MRLCDDCADVEDELECLNHEEAVDRARGDGGPLREIVAFGFEESMSTTSLLSTSVPKARV